ncbi:MAG: hypothetical protein ACK4Q4_10965, partial [Rhodocyclaceae bacterium]
KAAGGGRHPKIPPPPALYGPARRNSHGPDLTIAATRERLSQDARALPPAAGALAPVAVALAVAGIGLGLRRA